MPTVFFLLLLLCIGSVLTTSSSSSVRGPVTSERRAKRLTGSFHQFISSLYNLVTFGNTVRLFLLCIRLYFSYREKRLYIYLPIYSFICQYHNPSSSGNNCSCLTMQLASYLSRLNYILENKVLPHFNQHERNFGALELKAIFKLT